MSSTNIIVYHRYLYFSVQYIISVVLDGLCQKWQKDHEENGGKMFVLSTIVSILLILRRHMVYVSGPTSKY